MGKGINIIHTNCDPSAAQDTSLPRDSYLVTYGDNTEERFDVVQGLQSDIFDHYWDKWTDGKANPKMWGYKAPESKKRK
jgi:hypothetical protein